MFSVARLSEIRSAVVPRPVGFKNDDSFLNNKVPTVRKFTEIGKPIP